MEAVLAAKDVPTPALPGAGVWRDLLKLLGGCLALFGSAAIVALGIVWFVPEGNDYALATLKKHQRLASLGAGKVVFVGGSNLAFGLDSAAVSRALGRPVVNMGMNGFFGVRYMLEEVKPSLRPSDVVVIAFEYDNYFKSADGTPSDLMMIAKTNPTAFRYLSWDQRESIAGAVPYVAQQKVLRLLRSAGQGLEEAVGRGDALSSVHLVMSIETAAGFNEFGDLVSHLDVPWPNQREDGLDASKLPVDLGVVHELESFARAANAAGASVIVSYTPVIDYYYARHRRGLEALHQRLAQTQPLVVPSPPVAYVFPERRFFDTVYHLDREGRALRTERVVADIQRTLAATAGGNTSSDKPL